MSWLDDYDRAGGWDGRDYGRYTGGSHCRESHEPFELGGGEVLGYSCSRPKEGYDVYVGLARDMTRLYERYPWQDGGEATAIEFAFPITDMSVPENRGDFRRMIEWLAGQLADGKRVHVGCFGGHGRTGLLLAALVAVVMPDEKDPIGWVRERHCEKAVESQRQIDFLVEHYGARPAEPSKRGRVGQGGGPVPSVAPGKTAGRVARAGGTVVQYVRTAGNLWDAPFDKRK